MTKVGFIGLGNVGAKLAGTLQRNEVDLWVHDIEPAQAAPFLARGRGLGRQPRRHGPASGCGHYLFAVPQSQRNRDGGGKRGSAGVVRGQNLDRDEYDG